MTNGNEPLLIPYPRRLNQVTGTLDVTSGGTIHLTGERPADLWFTAGQLRDHLADASGQHWRIRAGVEDAVVYLVVDTTVSGGEEAYSLSITPQQVEIVGGGAAGVFYGCQTLIQLLRQYGTLLPCLNIEDAPDFPQRGFMLDISRDRVPKMETLFALVDRLAAWKSNHLQLYTEHTFAFEGHESVWRHASPMTGEEIMQLDAYCRQRFVQLVPNQTSFPHMNRWLIHPQYRQMAEAPDGWEFDNGQRVSYPFTINPLHPDSYAWIEGLFRDLLPHFTSTIFNANLDESWDLGQGASKEAVAQRGKAAVYFEFVYKLNSSIQSLGRQMLYWSDFYWDHPESVSMHPEDSIALEWGYQADHDFAGNTTRLAEAGVPFYVCPGTGSWNGYLGRTDNAIANILNATENGLSNGAIGFLNTNWGDNGSLEYDPISYLGTAFGAATSWCLATNRDLALADALSLHAFGDASGVSGQIAYDLGNAYRIFQVKLHNNNAPFVLSVKDMFRNSWRPVEIEEEAFRQSIEQVGEVATHWSQTRLTIPDADLVQQEFAANVAMWQHGCRCGLALSQEAAGNTPDWRALADELQQIVTEHHRLWLARNRPGGLSDSAARLGSRLPYYLNRLDA